MPPIGAAIVGCRAVAPLHAAAVAACPDTCLKMVFDVERSAADSLAALHRVPVAASFADLLRREEVDLVILVTPDETHADLTVRAAAAGKHVLVEKPFALTLAEADRMIGAAERNGVKLMCGQSLRFRPKFSEALSRIHAGAIGQPVFARIGNPSSPFWTPDDWQARGYNAVRGPEWLLMHNGAHQFDLLALLFGEGPAEVYTVSHPGQEWLRPHEYVGVNMRFQNGAIALSEENRIMQPAGHPFHCDFYVVGTEGTLDCSDRRVFSVVQYNQKGVSFPGAHIGVEGAQTAFTREVAAIARAIRHDETPEIPVTFTRRVLESLHAACHSLHSARNRVVNDSGGC